MAGAETIAAFFRKDHDEIEALLAAVDFADPITTFPRAAEFGRRLLRHIVWEERLLFPALARAAPALAAGPIAALKSEHRLIRLWRRRLLEALRLGDVPEARRRAAQLTAVLGPHDRKEDRVLYPACDRELPRAVIRRLLDEIRSGPAAPRRRPKS